MITHLIRIGNSQGIRIPKPLLKQVGLMGEVDMEVLDGALLIRPRPQARAGWDEAFAAMARRGDDAQEIESLPTDWDETEWEWK